MKVPGLHGAEARNDMPKTPKRKNTKNLKKYKKEVASSAGGLGTEIAALFAKCGLDAEIPELRGYIVAADEFYEPVDE
jgi:hypothetical protein